MFVRFSVCLVLFFFPSNFCDFVVMKFLVDPGLYEIKEEVVKSEEVLGHFDLFPLLLMQFCVNLN